MIRVAVVDDEQLVRSGLRLILGTAPDIDVVADCSGDQAVDTVLRSAADVVLLDIRMPDVDGLTVLSRLLAVDRPPAIAMLTTFDAQEYLTAALRAGAAGFLLKDTDPEQLVRAVRTLAQGGSVLDPAVTGAVIGGYLAAEAEVDSRLGGGGTHPARARGAGTDRRGAGQPADRGAGGARAQHRQGPCTSGARQAGRAQPGTGGDRRRPGRPDRRTPAGRWAAMSVLVDLAKRRGPLLVPMILGVADALLVNGVTLGLELNLSLIAAVALLLRRRLPVLVFLVCLPGIFIGYVWFAPMIALYTVAVRRPGRRLLTVSALLLLAAHFVPYPVSELEPTAYRENTLTLIDSFVTSVAPIALGLLVRTRGELAARIEELTRSRLHADELIADQVLSTERARLAREMHDVVAHQVSLISLQAGAVQISAEDPKAREGARTIRELSVRTLDELRHMVGVLRAAGGDLEELTPQPSLADLPRLIEMSALDVAYEADHEQDGHGRAPRAEAAERLGRPEAVERAAFRVVQEALTNVRKHAPGARVLVRIGEVELARKTRGLRVEVRNGPPDATVSAPGLPGGGHGLIGLRERAQLLGGTLDAHPTDDGGFLVRAEFPESS